MSSDKAVVEQALDAILPISAGLFIRNLISIILVSAFFTVPFVFVVYILDTWWPNHIQWLESFLLLSARILMLAYLIAAVSHWIFGKLGNQPRTLLQAVGWALRLIVPLTGTAVLCVVIALVGFVVFAMPGIVLQEVAFATGVMAFAAVGNILIAAGALTNVAVVITVLWVAVPVAIVERAGPFGGLRRSVELVRGNRSTVFGILIVFLLIELVLFWAGTIFPGMVAGLGFLDTPEFAVLTWALAIVSSAFVAVVTGVCYVLLRSEEAASKASAADADAGGEDRASSAG